MPSASAVPETARAVAGSVAEVLAREMAAFQIAFDDAELRGETHRAQIVRASQRRIDAHNAIVAQGSRLVTGMSYDEKALERAGQAHNDATADLNEAVGLALDDLREIADAIDRATSAVTEQARRVLAEAAGHSGEERL